MAHYIRLRVQRHNFVLHQVTLAKIAQAKDYLALVDSYTV